MRKLTALFGALLTACALTAAVSAEGYSLSHESGTYGTVQFVMLNADRDAQVVFTTDGTAPTADSEKWENLPIIVTENTVIRTAVLNDGELCEQAKTTIKIRSATPSSDAKSGTYREPLTVALSCPDSSAKIYYTTDGSTPSRKSERYTKPLTFSEDVTLKFCAYSENMARSGIVIRKYAFSSDVYADPLRQELFELVNITRAEYGLAPLSEMPALSDIAQKRAIECSGYFSHWRVDGTKWDSLLAAEGLKRNDRAENICYYHQTAQAALNSWMNDYAHRMNILDPDLKYIGIGCYENGGCKYWTQLFIGE